MNGQVLQGFNFFDVAALVLGEAVHKKPVAFLVRGD
jgi:hypothetical protein